MNPLAHLKTLYPRAARGGMLLAVLLAGSAGGASSLHAAKDGAPAYYAAYEIPAPAEYSGSQDRPVVVAMNDQGYAIVTNGFSSGGTILVYLKDHYIRLSTSNLNLNSPTSINATHLSNVAADGSFNVSGEGDFPEGGNIFHRVVFWHVNADGTSTAQMMKNHVLPENSQSPGEQQSATSSSVISSGVIGGTAQSYLAGVGAFWYPPNTMPSTLNRSYPADLDEAGNWCGGGYDGAVYDGGQLPLPTTDARAVRLKNGRILGDYNLSNANHVYIYDVAANTFAELSVYDPTSSQSSIQGVKYLDDAGDAIGESYSPNVNGVANDYTLWKRDPNTGAYTSYNVQLDIVGPAYPDTKISLVRYRSSVTALLADGTFVVNEVTDLYNNNQKAVVVFKPGADPRPLINLPAGSTSSIFSLHTDPGQPFSYQFTATNNPTTWALAPNSAGNVPTLPPGLTLDPATGLLSGKTTEVATYTFSVQATNGQGVGTLSRFVYLTSGEAPVITSAATATGKVGQAFSFQVMATNSPTNFYFTNLPDGLTYDYSTGLISGTPTAAGTFTVNEQVNNAITGGFFGGGATGTLTITIRDASTNSGTADLGLTVKDTPDPVVVGGQVRYNFTLKNKGPDKATNIQGGFVKDSKMSFVATGSAPGVVVNGNNLTFPLPDLASGATETFTLIFKADTAGVYTVGGGVEADQNDPTGADNGILETTLATDGSTAAHAPVITAAPGGEIIVGEAFQYQITTDGTVAVDAYTVTGLPTGLSVNASTGLIAGTLPAETAAGTFTVTLRAANGAGASTATRTFTTVAAPTGPKIIDVTAAFGANTGLKLIPDKGKYKFTGSMILSNLGTKAFNGVSVPGLPPKTPLSVGLYLSNSPTFSYPLTGDAAAAGLLPLAVTVVSSLDQTTGIVSYSAKVSVPTASKTGAVFSLPIKLGKAGKNPLTVPFSLKASAADLPAQVTSGQYRYLLVVLDPAGSIATESSKSNNAAALDLQTLLGSD